MLSKALGIGIFFIINIICGGIVFYVLDEKTNNTLVVIYS